MKVTFLEGNIRHLSRPIISVVYLQRLPSFLSVNSTPRDLPGSIVTSRWSRTQWTTLKNLTDDINDSKNT